MIKYFVFLFLIVAISANSFASDLDCDSFLNKNSWDAKEFEAALVANAELERNTKFSAVGLVGTLSDLLL